LIFVRHARAGYFQLEADMKNSGGIGRDIDDFRRLQDFMIPAPMKTRAVY